MKRLLLLSLFLAGCTIGAPPGFSSGTSWSAPLVGPLEGGELVVPVMVHDKGPFLFAIDPDSPVSHIDVALANELDLRTGIGPEFDDETDTLRTMKTAEVLRISIGNLTVRSRTFFASPVGTFNVAGRQIRGVIGRDILSESLAFGFDRDAGMFYIATQKGFTRPTNGIVIGYDKLKNRVPGTIPPVSRRLSTVKVGDKAVAMHIDLGDATSQLRDDLWTDAGLQRIQLDRTLVDETGTRRDVKFAGVAGTVSLGSATANGILFVAYGDKRWDELEISGSLGLNFFNGYAVWMNLDDDQVILVPRTGEDQAKARVDRWGNAVLSGCADLACTKAELLEPEPVESKPAPSPGDPLGGDVAPEDLMKRAPPPTRPILHVARSSEAVSLDMEVTLEARGTEGAVGLNRLVAIFPAGTSDVTMPLDTTYAGATFAVVDVSPFVRGCPREGACVYGIAEPK